MVLYNNVLQTLQDSKTKVEY